MKIIIKYAVPLAVGVSLLLLGVYACNKESSAPASVQNEINVVAEENNALTLDEAAMFQDWRSKSFSGSRSIFYPDPCSWLGKPGPFDPPVFFKTQLQELEVFKASAKGNTTILAIITKDSANLQKYNATWQKFTIKEKDRRQKLFEALKGYVTAGGDNIKIGLTAAIKKSTDPDVKKVASILLQRWPGDGCIHGCICVQGPGCPCCDCDFFIKSIFGSSL
jgi:hypothetical protein